MKKPSKGDREAMERAIALSLGSRDRAEAERVRDMLRTRPRAEVGWSCAISCQEKVLRTRPWQPVPAADYVAVTDRDDEGSPIMGRAAAAELLRRLLAAGLSRYEPDPLRALARIEAERGI
jgi:hypothetical protein